MNVIHKNYAGIENEFELYILVDLRIPSYYFIWKICYLIYFRITAMENLHGIYSQH